MRGWACVQKDDREDRGGGAGRRAPADLEEGSEGGRRRRGSKGDEDDEGGKDEGGKDEGKRRAEGAEERPARGEPPEIEGSSLGTDEKSGRPIRRCAKCPKTFSPFDLESFKKHVCGRPKGVGTDYHERLKVLQRRRSEGK